MEIKNIMIKFLSLLALAVVAVNSYPVGDVEKDLAVPNEEPAVVSVEGLRSDLPENKPLGVVPVGNDESLEGAESAWGGWGGRGWGGYGGWGGWRGYGGGYGGWGRGYGWGGWSRPYSYWG